MMFVFILLLLVFVVLVALALNFTMPASVPTNRSSDGYRFIYQPGVDIEDAKVVSEKVFERKTHKRHKMMTGAEVMHDPVWYANHQYHIANKD